MANNVAFIDCTSLNISYDVMGIATVSYTVVHNTPSITVFKEISAGRQKFSGYIIDAYMSTIPKTDGWYETHATMIATTN
jgi:hypothetical protein